ncbi:MAG: glycoside hydrolase family 1 protein [Clostridium sp.]
MRYNFPKDFWWGAASSATQMEGGAFEGGKGKNVWDHWFEIEPERFHNGVGPTTVTDFYHNYKEDIKTMKELGFNSFRTSIGWARLIPDGDGEVNQEAVKFYNDVFDEMIENGVEPFINLYHFDMPLAMYEIGGFENREVINAYSRYAKICFELFGSKVKKWFTFNEPIVPVECGYLEKYHLPGVYDVKRAMDVLFNTALANALAIKNFREVNIEGGEIGVILNLTPSYPRSNSEEDVKAANIADAFFNRSFLDSSVKGEFPVELLEILKANDLMPNFTEEDFELVRNNKVDILGVNYYQPRRIKAPENPKEGDIISQLFDFYDMPGKKINPHRGWEIYEKGIYDIMINLRDNYGNIKSFISENGMGVEGEDKFLVDGQIQDDYRIEFIEDHLVYLHKAIEEGANCKGYHLWTFIDNWSWLNSFKNRYGFVSLDLATGKRTIKKSGNWISKVSRENGFEK